MEGEEGNNGHGLKRRGKEDMAGEVREDGNAEEKKEIRRVRGRHGEGQKRKREKRKGRTMLRSKSENGKRKKLTEKKGGEESGGKGSEAT